MEVKKLSDDQEDVITSVIKNHEHGDKKLSDEIAIMIESLKPLPDQSKCCIYKVSDHIRQSNKEAYTPQEISIGPFHRNNPKLRKMEDFKLRYLKRFRGRAETKLEDIVSTIKDAEERVRECYSETITLGSDDFVKMILVDASFIIELSKQNNWKIWNDNDREILKPWLCNRMKTDLILLENQLPFFIINKIYETAFPLSSKKRPFIVLCFRQFNYYNVQHHSPHSELKHEILHFTDLLRHFCMPPRERPKNRRSEVTIKEIRSITQLDDVGLKFKKPRESSKDIIPSQLELKYLDGVLEIPPFQLDRNTEIYARNFVAFEECHYRQDAYITDYYTLLSFLIKTGKDVDLLVRKKIISNRLEGVVLATSVINRIVETIDNPSMNVNYQHIAEELNNFYDDRVTHLQLLMAILKREYFRNPWRGAATVGGILLLLLTVIQTLCALNSEKIWK